MSFKWAKRAGLIMFAVVFALNVQVMFNQDSQAFKGNVSLLGMELNLFKSASAEVKEINIVCADYGCPGPAEVKCADVKVNGIKVGECKQKKGWILP